MKIIIKKDNVLIGSRCYRLDDVIDLEVDGYRKKQLVESGVADWYDDAMRVATVTKVTEKAVSKKGGK